MLTQSLSAVVSGVFALIVAASTVAHIHGTILAIDSTKGVFQIRHDPFPLMPMVMTVEVQPKNPADLKKLHVGETIDCTVETSIDPWPATDIRPAAGR